MANVNKVADNGFLITNNENTLSNKIFIQTQNPRPDYRLVISFLWDDFHNVDTDGDSDNPASREWTYLYIMNRENKKEVINIEPQEKNPLKLLISSTYDFLANRAAYFLAKVTQGKISRDGKTFYDLDELKLSLGKDFNVAKANERVENSVFRNSTLKNPYPNLNSSQKEKSK